MFVFLSLLLNKKVLDANNCKVGTLYDISFQLTDKFPRAISLIVSTGSLNRKDANIPWEFLEGINKVVKLGIPTEKVSFTPALGSYEFTIVVCGAVVYKRYISVETAADAALALGPLAGRHALEFFVFRLFNLICWVTVVTLIPLTVAMLVTSLLGR